MLAAREGRAPYTAHDQSTALSTTTTLPATSAATLDGIEKLAARNELASTLPCSPEPASVVVIPSLLTLRLQCCVTPSMQWQSSWSDAVCRGSFSAHVTPSALCDGTGVVTEFMVRCCVQGFVLCSRYAFSVVRRHRCGDRVHGQMLCVQGSLLCSMLLFTRLLTSSEHLWEPMPSSNANPY
jgi:hypothetical protein